MTRMEQLNVDIAAGDVVSGHYRPAYRPVVEAFVNSFPADDRLKIGILISDEVGNDANTVRRTVDTLRNGQVTLHVLGVSRSCHEVLAKDTDGRFWDIQASRGRVDFSDLLDAVAKEISHLALR